MVRKGFRMKIYPDMAAEYEKRHNELWPEMKDMIHEYGGRNYTIFLDRATNILYGYIELEDPAKWEMVGLYGRYHGDQSGQQPGMYRSP